ncbi:unnamed protein product [Orchesella dallaii]|uniref:Carboxylic ester hydrolase n=1 Tax=Orchesella dallaii TaxID=48710 RepID=A0ABP1QY25_9HEXA
MYIKAPVLNKPWTGILKANNPGSPCIQLHYGRLRGSEDCLRLNVYSPSVNSTKRSPVIIYIHGGFWLSGSGAHYGPAYLVEHDVVLVTFNYRLGSLGYFSTGDDVASGNWGLKDQAAVIDWVYDNIANFGGDPERITLAGNSAGAVSTHLLMISNYHLTTKKLKGAISMSGSAYNVWGLNSLETSKKVSSAFANVSGCPAVGDSQAVVNCLRKVNANILVANQLLIFQTGFFLPSIEPHVPGAIVTLSPDQAYASGKVAPIPWIATMTSRELNLPIPALQANVVASVLRVAFSSDLSNLLSFRRAGVNETEVRKKILEFYTGGDSPNDLSRDKLSQIATDRYFTVSIRRAIQMHSQVAPTYASIFNYTSNLGRAGRRGLSPTEFGPLHGDDLVYFLNSTVNHPPIRRTDSHFAIAKLLVNLYGNFAMYGEPLFTSEDKKNYRIWDKIDNQENLRFLRIDEEVKVIDDPYKETSKFWESLAIPDTTSYIRL